MTEPRSSTATAAYRISGVVESIQPDEGTITLWLVGFDDLQTVLIAPPMPAWLLEAGVAFRTTIPYANKRARNLNQVVWGTFSRQPFSDWDEASLVERLGKVFNGDA